MFWLIFAAFVLLIVGYQFVGEVASRMEERRWIRKTAEYHTAVAQLGSQAALKPLATEKAPTEKPSSDTGASHLQHPDRWKGWRTVQVKSVKEESPDCKSFVFAPIDRTPFPPFAGGQSLLVRSTDPQSAKKISRCYSLSSGPGEDHYRITVKRVPGGKFSNLLHDHVVAGETIEIQAPRGKFFSDPDKAVPIHLIAAGIGITPMLSMLLHCLGANSKREINLFYQIRNSSNAPFLKPLRQLARSLPAGSGFRIHVWFSQPSSKDVKQADQVGRISAESILRRLGHSRGEFMICGPDVFMSELASELFECGVEEANIKYESFGGKAKGPGAISVAGDETENTKSVTESYQVRFSAAEKSGTWSNEAESVLDLAEKLDVDVDSGCRAGECGACVLALKCGTVRYAEEPECEIEPGEIVSCVAQPTSDLEIDA